MGAVYKTTLVFLTLACIAVFAACLGVTLTAYQDAQVAARLRDQAHQVKAIIQRRGIVSPSTSELLHNTVAFGVPSLVFFIMRL